MEQLSLGTAATEPVLYSPRAAATEPKCPRACAPQQEKPLHEKPRSTMTSSLHLPQLEKAHAAVKTQYGQKLIVYKMGKRLNRYFTQKGIQMTDKYMKKYMSHQYSSEKFKVKSHQRITPVWQKPIQYTNAYIWNLERW